MGATLGPEANLLDPGPDSCRQIVLPYPILTNEELAKLNYIHEPGGPEGFTPFAIDGLYPVADGGAGMRGGDRRRASAGERGHLRWRQPPHPLGPALDGGAGGDPVAPAHLRDPPPPHPDEDPHPGGLRGGVRCRREVHHMALLIGYGAAAVNPYLAFETVADLIRTGAITDVTERQAIRNYVRACTKGVLKVMSKMGISTVASYTRSTGLRGDRPGPGPRRRVLQWYDQPHRRHRRRRGRRGGGPPAPIGAPRPAGRAHRDLDIGGEYQWRREGEHHLFNPQTVFKLQHGTRAKRFDVFQEYTRSIDDQSARLGTLRGLFELREGVRPPVPIDEVEPVGEIVKRFSTGAMSYGSISMESHQTLALAMNRLGGKSNTGEGGEDADRLHDPDRRSAIKQVASGRFGVTSEYLTNADDLQIKMAQGAKPGEGGQLPGGKVYPWVARTRHSTPGVGLISPPPHHDIYSIEDLKQLIHDLKNANPEARIHVKLVAEVGVGTVAAGVSKAKADVVLISGHDGGTGASPLTSLKHAGAPWELGLAETQQTLLLNGLRDRIVVQVDGQMKTGRDVVVGALLGAEEFGFATAPLVVSGCIMMRVCHLDTCPVGIATQNPELRERFTGRPEFVETFFEYIATEVAHGSRLGFRSIAEAVGHVECLDTREAVDHWKASGLDLSPILHQPDSPFEQDLHQTQPQDHGLERALDTELIRLARRAPPRARRSRSICRSGTCTARGHPARTRDHQATPGCWPAGRHRADPVHRVGWPELRGLRAQGRHDAPRGRCQRLPRQGPLGRTSDRPTPRRQPPDFVAEDNIVAGNVILYGATGGEVYLRGVVGERFCVRNSGATAVVEGVGDHGCEYMTGGRAVVLGPTGRNFGAGMSGGVAYVLDPDGTFFARLNTEMVDLEPLDDDDAIWLRDAVRRHVEETGSAVAERLLGRWHELGARFRKVMPKDYKRVLGGRAHRRGAGAGTSTKRSWEQRMADPKGFSSTAGSCPCAGRCRCVCSTGTRSTSRSPAEDLQTQASRCMDCGIPFCNNGCPLGNLIPDWNDLVYRDHWRDAIERLHATNNFPEFTGRLCPAPCEAACVLGINQDPVTIKQVEVRSSIGLGMRAGSHPVVPGRAHGQEGAPWSARGPRAWPLPSSWPGPGTGRGVRAGRPHRRAAALRHPRVQDGEASPRPRLDQMRHEGVEFRPGVDVGVDVTVEQLRDEFDAVVLAGGATDWRDLPVPAASCTASTRRWSSCRGRTGPRRATSASMTRRSRPGQARRDHRRRRHRRRLPRHRPPAGRRLGAPARDHAPTAGRAARCQSLADLADDLPGLLRPRGGRRAGVLGQHRGVRRRRRRQRARAAAPRGGDGRGPLPRRSRAPTSSCRPTSSCSLWASSAPSAPACSTQLGVDLDGRGNVARSDDWMSSRRGRVRRRRHGPRPEPHRVGHRRGSGLRRRRRRRPFMGATSLLAPIRAPRPPPALRISARRRVTRSRQRLAATAAAGTAARWARS